MLRKFIIILLLLIASANTYAQQLPDSIKAYIDSSLLIMKQHSFYSNQINWPKTYNEVYAKAAGARSREDTYDAFLYAFKQLNDKHGLLVHYNNQYRVTDSALLKRFSPAVLAEWKKGVKIKISMIGNVAYVLMPSMPVVSQQDVDKYANMLTDSLAKLAKRKPSAWIIDLRLNGGGNFRPMLAGISSFFEDGLIFSFLDKEKHATSPVSFTNGKLMINDLPQCTINVPAPALHEAKIAVLIGPGTGSSGEATALALKLRKHTRLIGEPSAGYTNSTEGFTYNHNHSYLLLVTAHYGDKNNHYLPETIMPDVTVKSNDQFNDPVNDTTVQAALKWLK